MHPAAARVSIGLLMLAGLWIAVYWWWPTEPPITVAEPVSMPQPEPPAPATGGTPAPPAPQPQPDQPEPQPPAVIPPEFFRHTIEKGDTLQSISKRYFGTTRHASAIARANPLTSPPDLKPGRVILVPRDPDNIQGIPTKPEAEPKVADPRGTERTYVVQSGDTLSKISKTMYGSTRHARAIFEANRSTMADEDALKVGQKLKIPPIPGDTGP